MMDVFSSDTGTLHFTRNVNQKITGFTLNAGRIRNSTSTENPTSSHAKSHSTRNHTSCRSCLVKGHDFSRAAEPHQTPGLQPLRYALQKLPHTPVIHPQPPESYNASMFNLNWSNSSDRFKMRFAGCAQLAMMSQDRDSPPVSHRRTLLAEANRLWMRLAKLRKRLG